MQCPGIKAMCPGKYRLRQKYTNCYFVIAITKFFVLNNNSLILKKGKFYFREVCFVVVLIRPRKEDLTTGNPSTIFLK